MTAPRILDLGYTERDLMRVLCAKSLREFAEAAWDTIERNRKFVPGWHIDAICEHLEACTRGEIRNLVINMPPRHMKSTLVSVLWPAWSWISKPETRWIFGSYGQGLATRDSMKTRRVTESAWYQSLFGDIVTMSDDQNAKTRFENKKSGYRLAISVGSGTGEGADFVVADDPHKTDEAESKASRERTLIWWDQTMSTRANNPETFCKVIVMQRVHDKDLSGHVLEQGGYEHLCLPAEYTGKKYHTSIGFEDPRINSGDLLWPERFNKENLDELKKRLGSAAAQGQLQQDPIISSGGLFKRLWWKWYAEKPHFDRIVQFWDCAQKVGITNDYSVCATWGETATGYYLIDLWRNKVEAPQLEQAIISQHARFNPTVVVIEDKSSGSSAIQAIRQKTRIPVLAYDPRARDKEVRASAATPMVEAGKCHLPMGAPFVEEFILEHEKFPNAENDDQVDTTSMAAEYFSQKARVPRVRYL